MQIKPIEINFKDAFFNWLGKNLVSTGLATRADLPQRATPDVVIRSESIPTDRLTNFTRLSEQQFVWLAMQNPWAFSNARLLGHIVAEGVLEVQERSPESTEKWLNVESHPFEGIIEGRPNRWMSQYYAWLYQTIWFLMKGEAYWLVIKNDLGEPVEMYPLPASRVLPIPGKNELFSAFAYSPVTGEKPNLLLPEDVCYHRFPNIFHYFRGWSNLNAYLVALQTDREAAEFDLRDYEHGLELKQIVSFRPELDDTEFLTALDDLAQAQEMGLRFMGIRGGDVDVKNITQRRAESGGDIRQQLASIGGRIFAVFDGFWDKSANRASSERAEENTIAYGAWPLMRMFAEDLTAQVVIPAYGQDTRVIFRDIRPRNQKLDIEKEKHEWSAMTWDEVQERKGREPHPDPDIGNAPFLSAPKIAELKLAFGGGVPDVEVSVEEKVVPQFKEIDLRQWRTVCSKLLKRGKRPEYYEFRPNYLTEEEVKNFRQLLTQCQTLNDIKAILSPTKEEPFVPEGAAGFQPSDPSADELAQLAEDEVEEFSQEFDELLPDLSTILEAEAEEIENETG